jgi:hypothetical protein
MTQAAGTETGGRLEDYRAREAVLYNLREVLETTDRWEDFRDELERRGLPEERIRQVVDVPVKADLHLHSTASDGMVPARKLAWLARAIGLETVALADHDSVAGCRFLYGEATLLGVRSLPAVELSTDQPGLEVLVYFPDAGRFFDFMTTPRGVRFARYLERKQAAVHEASLEVMASVNRWLKRRGLAPDDPITEAEVDAWYGGEKPYYPGTLAVLGLKRLDPEARKELGIRDPRQFNTKVVTPALKRLGFAGGAAGDLETATAEVRKQLAALRRSRVGSVAILPHPKELVSKGKMSLGQVARTLEYLVAEAGLDGVEIGCSRDGAEDVAVWREMVEELDGRIAAGDLKAPGPMIVASYSSDFHVLAPGRATGEITLGFGVLDERPGHRRGNLRPQGPPEALVEELRRRGALRRRD